MFREARVHTAATSIQALYNELQGQRGYAMDFGNVRVSCGGEMGDPTAMAQAPLRDGMRIGFIGPNRGG